MKRLLFFLPAVLFFSLCLAQNGWDRRKNTVPPDGLQRVRGMLTNIKKVDTEDGDGFVTALPEKTYTTLSFREKFTNHMIHPETYSQNCDIEEPVPDQEKKIFGQLPRIFGEYHWSDRQYRFFKDNRDSVMALITESIGRTGRVGLNYKQVLVDIKATEMIPTLISTYNLQKKDHDILTVLMLLMEAGKNPSFMSSASYRKLYADKESSYRAWLVYNTANEELIIQRATDFYNGRHQ